MVLILVTKRNFSEQLKASLPDVAAAYISKLCSASGKVNPNSALRFPLQLALLISPICLLLPLNLDRRNFSRNALMQWSTRLGVCKPDALQQTEKRIWRAILDIVMKPAEHLTIVKDLASDFSMTYIQELQENSEAMPCWFNINLRQSEDHTSSGSNITESSSLSAPSFPSPTGINQELNDSQQASRDTDDIGDVAPALAALLNQQKDRADELMDSQVVGDGAAVDAGMEEDEVPDARGKHQVVGDGAAVDAGRGEDEHEEPPRSSQSGNSQVIIPSQSFSSDVVEYPSQFRHPRKSQLKNPSCRSSPSDSGSEMEVDQYEHPHHARDSQTIESSKGSSSSAAKPRTIKHQSSTEQATSSQTIESSKGSSSSDKPRTIKHPSSTEQATSSQNVGKARLLKPIESEKRVSIGETLRVLKVCIPLSYRSSIY